VIDKGGMGYPLYCTLQKTIIDIVGFDGAEEARKLNAGNRRADGYLLLKEMIDEGKLIIGKWEQTIKELEIMKRKYRADGLVYIQSKEEMRSDGFKSPDRADSLMMAVWAISNALNRVIQKKQSQSILSQESRQSITEYDPMNY
jgi:hypothetical protein